MQTQTNSQALDAFFDHFKKLECTMTFSEVEIFLQNPNKVAPKLKLSKVKYLNLIVMSCIIIVLFTILFSDFSDQKTNISESPDKLVQPVFIDTSNNHSETQTHEEMEIQRKNKLAAKSANTTKSNQNAMPGRSVETINNETNLSKSQLINDTLIWGNPYILRLSSDELEKLGFQVEKTGIYYKNEYQGHKQTFHSRFENNFGETSGILNFEHPKNKKADFTHFDFYPVIISNINYETRTIKPMNKDAFEIMNDTLIAVELDNDILHCDCGPRLMWFNYTPSFFDQLPARYSSFKSVFQKINKLKDSHPANNFIYYTANNEPPFKPEFIELPKTALQKLGFNFTTKELSYINQYESGSFKLEFHEKFYGISMDISDSSNQQHINLLFLSDTNGVQNLKWKTMFEDTDKYDDEFFTSLINTMIPVIIRKDSFPYVLKDDYVFWFAVTHDFLNALPENIETELRQEYEMVKSNTLNVNQNSDCKYYEACKNTLPFSNLKFYPNPVKQKGTLEFISAVAANGKVVISSISGSMLNTVIESLPIENGKNLLSIDFQSYQPGLYLITIVTREGKFTIRVLKVE